MKNSTKKVKKHFSDFFNTTFFCTDLRKQQIISDIVHGSDPRINYYLLLLLSALIATFGLLANSPAVVIGAMLVSPLMTPIFGVALSLVLGDTKLLRSATLALGGGVGLAICASALVGYLPLSFEVTNEILSRTSPTLLDLVVAALAGFAGCLAIIDERISPILPGIAIATSLTPPLAASGLCFAFGAYDGGLGAFILFFANFLAILFIASITFIISGFITGRIREQKTTFAKRFSLATISLIVIVFFLTNALIKVVETKKTRELIKRVMTAELSMIPGLSIKKVVFKYSERVGALNALAIIDAPREPQPRQVEVIENLTAAEYGAPVNLFIRTRITKGVTSSKANLQDFYQSADGLQTKYIPTKDAKTIQIANQVFREIAQRIPGLTVRDVELRRAEKGEKYVYVTVQGPERPLPGGVRDAEQKLQRALGDANIRAVVRFIESYDITSHGLNLFDVSVGGQENADALRLEAQVRERIAALPDLLVLGAQARHSKRGWVVAATVNGARVITPHEVAAIETEMATIMNDTVHLLAHSKAEVVTTSTEYRPGYVGKSVDGVKKEVKKE